MRLVIDTNVIISGLVYNGSERRLLRSADGKRFDLFLSEFILGETSGVLRRKFGWPESRIALELAGLRADATVLEPPRFVSVIEPDHPDNRILECAVFGEADYLVTGDRKHLLPLGEYEGVKIVRAPEFLELIL